jgi:glycosyltransferase involved in cell wall biosynthesis
MRLQLGIPESTPVVAWVGRWHPDKAPEDALEALALLRQHMPSAIMLMAGTGCGIDDPDPSSALSRLSLQSAVRLLGRRNDAISVMAAADALCLSSHSESFPNVLAESMLAGTPCVSTNTGDARDIIGSTGVVVEARSPHQLANGLYALLNEAPAQIVDRRRRAHDRIARHFSMMRTACAFDNIWRTALDRKHDS